jgi:GT2 family glycosyltransferase
LDEDCFFGGEELDYSMRARSAGYLTLYVPLIVAMHNNFIRSGSEGKERQVQWVFNYTRVLFKNLPMQFAFLNSFRNLLGHIIHGSRESGIKHGISILKAAFMGLRKGLSVHKKLSRDAVAFYRRSDIRPEFGNVPIVVKLMRYLTTNHTLFQ